MIGAVAGASIQLSSAFFSDTETSTGNLFQAGTIDLKINDEDNPTAIVEFADLKPGDTYLQPGKNLRVIDNDAYVWMHIKDVVTDQGQQTDPEDEEELADGAQHNINDYLTYLLSVDGNNVINPAIDFNDAVSCWIPLGQVPGGQLIPMNQTFHFDDEVTNWAQGDTMTFTEEFYAVQARNNEDPLPPESETGRVWNAELGICEDESPLLWQIGDVENSQTDNPADEFRFTSIGQYPDPSTYSSPFTRIITSQIDDTADLDFPWNSDYGFNYAREIDVQFDYSGPTTNARLTLRWSPGASGTENKQIQYDGNPILSIGPVVGTSNPAWWGNYPMREDTVDISLSSGTHTFKLLQTTGNGTVWDWVKLEKI